MWTRLNIRVLKTYIFTLWRCWTEAAIFGMLSVWNSVFDAKSVFFIGIFIEPKCDPHPVHLTFSNGQIEKTFHARNTVARYGSARKCVGEENLPEQRVALSPLAETATLMNFAPNLSIHLRIRIRCEESALWHCRPCVPFSAEAEDIHKEALSSALVSWSSATVLATDSRVVSRNHTPQSSPRPGIVLCCQRRVNTRPTSGSMCACEVALQNIASASSQAADLRW